MRCLGIPNTRHFHEITLIEDAYTCKFKFWILHYISIYFSIFKKKKKKKKIGLKIFKII